MACLCHGGCIKKEGDGQESYLVLECGKEYEGDTVHWFLRAFMYDSCSGRSYADNFAVNYCPICGREL